MAIMEKLDRFKSLVEILGVVAALGLSSWSNCISKKALKSVQDTLGIQMTELNIRNRPLIALHKPEFGDSYVYMDRCFPRSIVIKLYNILEIPALNV